MAPRLSLKQADAQTIIVSLEHERYRKLILQVADPAETVGMLRAAIGQRR